MKRLLLLCLTYIMCVGNHQMAAQDSSESPGIFNSLAVGVSASTTGIGIDVASPIGSYLAVRAGVSFMPNFTYSTDVDVDIEGSYEGNIPTSIDVEGGMGRTAGEILLNVYPNHPVFLYAVVLISEEENSSRLKGTAMSWQN